MAIIQVEMNSCGHITLSFVNAKITRHLNDETAYLQSESDIESFLGNLSHRTANAIRAGYRTRIRMDGWIAAHYWGYDAHTLLTTIGQRYAQRTK
jgi:hypothetical protein